jgi:hypothetical protein
MSDLYYVDENRLGIPMGHEGDPDRPRSVVKFAGQDVPSPHTIVSVPGAASGKAAGVVQDGWKPAHEWTSGDAINVEMTLDGQALKGGIDPVLLEPTDADGFEAVSITVGGKYVVLPSDRARDFLTHYTLVSHEQETEMFTRVLSNGSELRAPDGKPVRFTRRVAERAVGLLGDENVASVIGQLAGAQARDFNRNRAALEEARRELGRLESQLEARNRELERLSAEVTEQEARLASVREELAVAASQRDDAQRQHDAINDEVRTLKERVEKERRDLENGHKKLRIEHDELRARVEVMRQQAQIRHDEEDSRVERLRGLGALSSEREALERIRDRLEGRATLQDLVGIHVALKHFPFLVLSGPSGSGKSSLLRMYGEALGMLVDVVPVQPNWTSVADLHGFVYPIGAERHFVTTPFSRALGMQVELEEFLNLVVLDEINLSHVEYYLADYLSAFEGDRMVALATAAELEAARAPDWLATRNGRVHVPKSFLLAGTANEDHTTRAFSDKFRDRMAALELKPRTNMRVGSMLSKEAPLDASNPVGRVTPDVWADWSVMPGERSVNKSGKAFETAGKLMDALSGAGIRFGHRQYRDVELFVRAAEPLLGINGGTIEKRSHEACDVALEMRVLQKSTPYLDALRVDDPGRFQKVMASVSQAVDGKQDVYKRTHAWIEHVDQRR